MLVNLLEPEPGETALHRRLPIKPLLHRAAAAGIVDYRILHGRSHLVAYRGNGDRAGVAGRALGRARLAAGRLRARIR